MSKISLPIGSYFSKTADGNASIYRIGNNFYRSDEHEISMIDDIELDIVANGPDDEDNYEYNDEPVDDDDDFEWEEEFTLADEPEDDTYTAL